MKTWKLLLIFALWRIATTGLRLWFGWTHQSTEAIWEATFNEIWGAMLFAIFCWWVPKYAWKESKRIA